jgi:DNA-binding Lrp family transcriptional regulator
MSVPEKQLEQVAQSVNSFDAVNHNPESRLEEVAEQVNSFDAVNHNYEREHKLNLWFVATAANEEQLQQVLQEIEATTGIEVIALPMLEDYHIDLGFDLQWT